MMSHCSWGSWGPFKGSIAEGQCGTQRRHRNAQMVWNYVNKVGMCGETVAKCPKESDSQTRPWCKSVRNIVTLLYVQEDIL